MSHSRMSGQLQNSRTLNKIVYANQLGSIESGTNGGQLLYYTEEGIPTSNPNLTILENPNDSAVTVDITGNLNVTDKVAINGTVVQGPGALGAIGLNPGSAVLSYHNAGRYVEIAADTTNNAYLDFHSKDVNTNNDYDARILSSGGGTGVNGGADLTVWAKSTNIIGPTNIFNNQGYDQYSPGLAIGGTINQYRQFLTQKRVWTGGDIVGNYVMRTALVDNVTGLPLVGKYSVSMGCGTANNNVYATEFYLMRVNEGSIDLLNFRKVTMSEQGNNLANFNVRVTQSIPSLLPYIEYENTTGAPAKYMIIFEGFIDNTGY